MDASEPSAGNLADRRAQSPPAQRSIPCIIAAMLDPKQRHQLLMAGRTGDPTWVAATIEQLLVRDPDTELFEIEAVLREAAARSYLIADGAGFRIVIGMQAWIAELDRLGRTPEQNPT